MANGYCINCENRIDLGKKPFIGQSVICNKCGADMEVIELSPIELDWVYGDYEDIDEEELEYWESSD
jgi:lysine biosynthesis protein LysW